MTIEAKILAHSVDETGDCPPLVTFELRYPRFIHAEFMTHRLFSRNASSSRAIPVKRLIDDIRSDPAMPIHWGKNQPGMQAREEHDAPVSFAGRETDAKTAWFNAMSRSIMAAQAFDAAGYHKQIVNRLLEPFSHIRVVATATSLANFYALRRHEDAQPEIKALADAMREAQQASWPRVLRQGEWHLPYVDEAERENFSKITAVKLSIARCARVSYKTHDGRAPDVAEDLKLYERLVGSVPLHASPAEHQATPDWLYERNGERLWANSSLHGNLLGYRQYRKMLQGEFVKG